MTYPQKEMFLTLAFAYVADLLLKFTEGKCAYMVKRSHQFLR